MMPRNPGGQLSVITGYGKACEIDNEARVREYMLDLSLVAEMTIFEGPHVERVTDEDGNGGVSANVMWKESGAMYHAWPERGGYFRIVIDSCKRFNIDAILGLTRRYFLASELVARDGTELLADPVSIEADCSNFKKPPMRDDKYREYIQGLPCDNCGAEPPNQHAHLGIYGLALKTDDYRANSLCPACHGFWHSSEPTDTERQAMKINITAKALDHLVEWIRLGLDKGVF